MTEETARGPAMLETLKDLFSQNSAVPPENWDIKITHTVPYMNPDKFFFPRRAQAITGHLEGGRSFNLSLGEIEIVGAQYEKDGDEHIVHQYLRLKDLVEIAQSVAGDEGKPAPTREEIISDLMQSPYLLASCINLSIMKVEDFQGNVLDVESVVVPFIPANTTPTPKGPAQTSLTL